MSILKEIEQQGRALIDSENRTRAALKSLQEANTSLLQEVEVRTSAEKRLRILCDLMTQTKVSLPEKIMLMLREACLNLKLQVGIVAEIKDDVYKVVYSWSEPSYGSAFPPEKVLPGTMYDLDNTYCKHIPRDGTPLLLSHAGQTEWKDYDVYQHYKVETYLGVCLKIEDDFWGTLCFFDVDPQEKPYTPPDSDFLRLMGQWIGTELSRQNQRLKS